MGEPAPDPRPVLDAPVVNFKALCPTAVLEEEETTHIRASYPTAVLAPPPLPSCLKAQVPIPTATS